MSENKAKFQKSKWGIAQFSNAYFCKKLSEAVVFVKTILNRDPVRGGSGGQLNPLEF